MKKIRENKKIMISQLENESAGGRKPFLVRALSAVLCVCIAIIACAGFSLIEILRLKGRSASITDGSDKIRIYIDQGHNPSQHHNSGAEGNGLYEQDITFTVGQLLAERLEEDGRFEVCLSRPDESTVLGTDTASSLKARVDGAVEFDADYFISLHVNSYTEDSANGIEVFVSGKDGESYAFGSAMLSGMLETTGLKSRGMKQGPDLYVLKHAEMPAALLEMGFISNAEDAALMSEQPELLAQGIHSGILDHFEFSYSQDINILLITLGISVTIALALTVSVIVIKKRNFIT